MTRCFLLVLLCALAVAACAGRSPDLGAAPVAVDAARAAAMVNELRARQGLPPVRVERRLMRAASSQALAMAKRNRMSHNVGEGALPRRLEQAGYSAVRGAENIAAGHRALEGAMQSWERSAAHRRNLLLAEATEIGIGAAHAPGAAPHGTFWALILAEPRAPSGAPRTALEGLFR